MKGSSADASQTDIGITGSTHNSGERDDIHPPWAGNGGLAMLKPGVKLLLVTLALFTAATAIRFTALIWYPDYMVPAHLVSSILLGLSVIPIILLVISSRLIATADVSPGIMRTYKIICIAIAVTMTFLGSYIWTPTTVVTGEQDCGYPQFWITPYRVPGWQRPRYYL